MPSDRSKAFDYKPLTPSRKKTADGDGSLRLSPSKPKERPDVIETSFSGPATQRVSGIVAAVDVPVERTKTSDKIQKENTGLTAERWLARNGHALTYVALFLFTLMVFLRPYELTSSLSFLSGTTVYFAILTIVLFIPGQIATEGNLTKLTTEVKAILAMAAISLITIPIARNPLLAWETFSDPYIKAVVIFIILINVVRTRKRMLGLMWLSLAIAIYLSTVAIKLYMAGEFAVEGYRVAVTDGEGMFSNPNDMAIHLVTMSPIALALGLASKNLLARIMSLALVALLVAATMFSFSRGGFLGLLGVAGVFAWKAGRAHRARVTAISIVSGIVLLLLAPGNYGLRMLSIFIPSLDPVGSADARREGLITSIIVTIRNPWGIGIGNSTTFGAHNLQTHNAYTQVSSELGILGLIAYLVFIVSPFRKLGTIERTQFEADSYDWFYYLAIGLQASIVGYLITSFFASVAYNWYIYYLVAYAVAFRRIYALETVSGNDATPQPSFWDRPLPAAA